MARAAFARDIRIAAHPPRWHARSAGHRGVEGPVSWPLSNTRLEVLVYCAMDELGMSKGMYTSETFADTRLGNLQIVSCLEIEPVLRRLVKRATK